MPQEQMKDGMNKRSAYGCLEAAYLTIFTISFFTADRLVVAVCSRKATDETFTPWFLSSNSTHMLGMVR